MTAESTSSLFSDGKAPDALRTIGEVAKALKIRQHVLRYWEEQFPMLRPLKRSGGRRYYRPDDIALVARIDRLVHREGYTLRGARQALQGGHVAVENARPAATNLAEKAGATDWPASAETAGPGLVAQKLVSIRDRLVAALN